MVSASASVVTGEFVAALPAVKPVSPLVATQLMAGSAFECPKQAKRAKLRVKFLVMMF
jgi:hypothetical protein